MICNEFMSEDDALPKEAISHDLCLTCEEKHRKDHGIEGPESPLQLNDFTD
jgi:hypothetical protein